jgi:hypothetical protein
MTSLPFSSIGDVNMTACGRPDLRPTVVNSKARMPATVQPSRSALTFRTNRCTAFIALSWKSFGTASMVGRDLCAGSAACPNIVEVPRRLVAQSIVEENAWRAELW